MVHTSLKNGGWGGTKEEYLVTSENHIIQISGSISKVPLEHRDAHLPTATSVPRRQTDLSSFNSDLMGPQSLIYTLSGPSCLQLSGVGSLLPGGNCVLDELLEHSRLRWKNKAKGSLQRKDYKKKNGVDKGARAFCPHFFYL